MAKVIRRLKSMYSPTIIRIRRHAGTAGWGDWWPGNVEVCRRLRWVDNAGSQGGEAQGLAGEDVSKSWSTQSVLVESEVLGASSELGGGLDSRNASVKKWAFLVARAIYDKSKMAFSTGFADI